MGLVRKKEKQTANVDTNQAANSSLVSIETPLSQLLDDYQQSDIVSRRDIAKRLREYPQVRTDLVQLCQNEPELLVREALLNSLRVIIADQSEEQAQTMVQMLELLRVADASLRAQVIRFVGFFPETLAHHIPLLLTDEDSNIRLYTLDILQVMVHPSVPGWLLKVIENDTHENVVISAIDRCVEAGCQDMLPLLNNVSERFSDSHMIHFAIKMATERLAGDV